MEKNLHNKDFEQFVKQNADQYRMFPSEKVWNGVYSALHTNKRWYGFGIALLLMTAISVTLIVLNFAGTKQISAKTEKKSSPTQTNSNLQAPLNSTFIQRKSSIAAISTKYSGHKTEQPASSANKDLVTISNFDITNLSNEIISINPFNNIDRLNINTEEYNSTWMTNRVFFPGISKSTIHNNLPLVNFQNTVTTYRINAKSRKINWWIYITPTISYRKLSENKSFLRRVSIASGPTSYAAMYNVNSVVTHKPDMGFEIGTVGDYSLTKNIKLLAGLQFNINRYGIKAFTYPGEIATIALNGALGSGSDSVSKWTNYRNFNGYNSNWLQNFYFSVSAPLGVELNLSRNSKTQFGIAGTVQPTLIISDKAYLISTDFQNYVQVPWLIRRWNVNTSFETFVSLSTGKINWRIGPQVRYQLLSSFQNKYPVKENLFDFGLKIGIMLNK